MKKWLLTTSASMAAAVGSTLLLDRHRKVPLWDTLGTTLGAVWDALTFRVGVPLSLLILALLPYAAFLVWVVWENVIKKPTDMVTAPVRPLNPVTDYVVDAVFDVLWSWSWGENWDGKRVRAKSLVSP